MNASYSSTHVCATFSTIFLAISLSLCIPVTFAQPVTDAIIAPLSTKDGAVNAKSVAKKPIESKVPIKANEARLIGPKSDLAATGINKPTPPTPPKDELMGKVKKPVAPVKNKKLDLPSSTIGDRATGINKPTPPTPPKDELKPVQR